MSVVVPLTKMGNGEESAGLEAKESRFEQVYFEALITAPRKEVDYSGRYSDLECKENITAINKPIRAILLEW